MAMQSTQVPMYTNTLFLYFSDFSIFIFYFYNKQNKAKTKNKQTNKNMLNNAKYKTRLT